MFYKFKFPKRRSSEEFSRKTDIFLLCRGTGWLRMTSFLKSNSYEKKTLLNYSMHNRIILKQPTENEAAHLMKI